MAGEVLPSTWRWSTLGEMADPNSKAIVSGPFGSNIGSRFFVEQGVPVIRGNNLTTNMTRFVDEGFVFVTEEKSDELGNCDAVADDLVFTAAGSLGQVGIIPRSAKYDRYIISNKQLRARVDARRVDPLFAFYWFSSKEMVEYVQQRNTGSSVPLINLSVLRSLPLPVPPLPEQRSIAHILGTLDDKIEMNRRMNKTLEAMSRALFKSWFVDFDPVRAKAEGRDPDLPKPLAGLFPARLIDSELGGIPEGWEVGCVDDEFELTMGQSPPGETYNEAGEGLPFYQGRTDFGSRFPTRRVSCTASTRMARVGDTLISVRAPVGDINMASEDCAIGRGVAAARHKTGSRSYTYQFMCSLRDDFACFEAEGTVFGSIGKKDFHAIPCVIPRREVVVGFETLLYPVDSRIEFNERESRTLAALRDDLLPKLIRGESRVKDAERFLKERGL